MDYRYSLEPLSAKGSLAHGGRFNVGQNIDSSRFSSFPCLYVAEDYDTAANSQIFARFLKEAGFEGVLYRSTKCRGLCAALFPDNLGGSDSYIELADRAPPEVKIKRLDHNTAGLLY